MTDLKAVAQRAIGLLDLTDLTDNCNHAAIDALCEKAVTSHGPVAAVCIWPRFVAHARSRLSGTDVQVATVVNFPGGNQAVDMTVTETRSAIQDGAHEIDLVLPYGALKAGDEDTPRTMVEAIADVCADKALLKVIIESGELVEDALIDRASHLAMEAGADFIKTSTGKVSVNATLETAERMITAISNHNGAKPVGFKPAGGIKTTQDCADYLAIADRILGQGWATPSTFRFGASSVLANLLATLEGKDAVVGEGY
ncbi:MAG: deoxyribose-phosphate aldolase [Pseudomonadota bacterium]